MGEKESKIGSSLHVATYDNSGHRKDNGKITYIAIVGMRCECSSSGINEAV